MKYALYLGCAIPIKYPGFEAATRLVCERLGIELVDDFPFSCCPPPTGLKMVHYDSWLALAARNLCLAEEAGLDLLTLCSGCVNTLKEANQVLKHSDTKRRKVNKILEEHNRKFNGTIEVTHILDVLYQDSVVDKLIKLMEREIPLRVGCHYGCHYFRPPQMMYPNELSEAESYVPVRMDHLLSIIGVEPTEYSRKFLCCGSPLGANVDSEAGCHRRPEAPVHPAAQYSGAFGDLSCVFRAIRHGPDRTFSQAKRPAKNPHLLFDPTHRPRTGIQLQRTGP